MVTAVYVFHGWLSVGAPPTLPAAFDIELPTAVYDSLGIGWRSKWESTAETTPRRSQLPVINRYAGGGAFFG